MSLRTLTADFLHRLPMSWHRVLPPKARKRVRHTLGRYGTWELSFDHTPPALRPGEMSGPPHFVGIGAQKAGTSWWYDMVVAHPAVYSRKDMPKELQYLTRFGTEGFGSNEIATYCGWFAHTEDTVAGEWTAEYLHLPWVPYLLSKAAPDVRLLLIVRDPIERFRSGLAHSFNMGELEYVTPVVADAITRSLYSAALTRWLDYFDKSQLLVLQYEMNFLSPETQLARTYEFLGLDSSFQPSYLHKFVNQTSVRKVKLDQDTHRRLVDIFTPDVAELTACFASIDVALWPNFAG